MAKKTKRIYMESLGCSKNQVDSEILLSYAMENGYEVTKDLDKADVIVVNSCGFIQSAKEESINTVLQIRDMQPHAKIILAGCLAQRYGEEMDFEEVDAIFGNHDLSAFPEVLHEVEDGEEGMVVLPETPEDPYHERDDRKLLLSFPNTAFLKISEGCNHRCGYCAIPGIRGPLVSRPMDRIIEEAKRLISEGVKEINVIAQDLGAYGWDWDGKGHLVELMDELSSLEGDFWLRMLYILPDTFPHELISLVKEREKIIPYFDIPFQHASEKVLKPMFRKGTLQSNLALIKEIRTALPDAVIRTTLMLGYPGEDREAFDELLEFVREAKIDWMGSFLYSREEDTAAYNMRGEEEHEKAHKIAAKWQEELVALQDEVSHKQMERFVGKNFRAIVEEKIEGEDLVFGRIYAQAQEVDGVTVIAGRDMKPGDMVDVHIMKTMGFDLDAVRI